MPNLVPTKFLPNIIPNESFLSQPLGKLGSGEHQMSPSSLLHLLSDWLRTT